MGAKRNSQSQDEEDIQTEQSSDGKVERTQTAKEIAALHEKLMRLARDRERLPQPLFWSLFNSRIQEIKKNKELQRLLSDVLG
jgi:TATA-binding protein-associated factor Taf7